MKTRFLLPALLFFTLGWDHLQAQWTSLGSGITASNRLMGVFHPVNEQVIWASALPYNSSTPAFEFTRTTDGGQTWLPGTLNGVGSAFYTFGIYALDDQTAWIATADELDPISGRIYKTTDGGLNWTHQSTAFTGFNETPAGVWFWNENEGFAYGATCGNSYNDQLSVYTTANGGENWSKSTLPAQLPGEGICLANFGGFFSVAGDHIWFGTNKNRIFRSSDRGLTWQVATSPFPAGTNVASVGFRDSLHGIALGFSPFRIARSKDGGKTWTTVPVTVPTNFRGWEVQYVPATEGTWFIASSYADYMVSYDDGNTWETHPSNIDSWSVKFLSPSVGFSGSYVVNSTTGGLYKWTGPSLRTPYYVNDDATGANNGTSWKNAFTNLQDALSIAEEGDRIWVAEGTYNPAGINGNSLATFLIDKNLTLLGGFEGGEATSDMRDPKAHKTILSGDLNGDDVEDDFLVSRVDNVSTVVTISPGITNKTIIDGFTITGGQADGTGDNLSSLRSGGGMYASGSPVLNQITFTQNFASHRGAGAYFSLSGSPVIENAAFRKNKAGNFGGGLSMDLSETSNPEVHHCKFENNEASRGGGVAFRNCNYKLTNCSFLSNKSIQQAGAMFHRVDNDAKWLTIEVQDCQFENNESTIGGGFFIETYETSSHVDYKITNSVFKENSCDSIQPGWGVIGGGGFFTMGASNSTVSINNCQFLQNSSTIYLGGFGSYIYGNKVNLFVKNSTFSGNACPMESSAFVVEGDTPGKGTVFVNNCIFENNAVTTGGTVLFRCGFQGSPAEIDFVLKNSTVKNNLAGGGGGIWLWKDNASPSSFTVENCIIEDNTASERGGGILMNGPGSNFPVTIKNSSITGNQSPDGGAISAQPDDPAGVSLLIENTLIAGNSSVNTAAVSIASTPEFRLINCTVADNNAGAIHLANQSGLSLQNTILANPGYTEFASSTNDVSITSKGGNLIGDNSITVLLPSDKANSDPMFVGSGDYHLTDGSPCVNTGINDGVTATFDLGGNPRIMGGVVDMGAYESPFLTPAHETITGEIMLSPNPASDFIQLQLPASATQPNEISLFDPQGRLVERQSFTPGEAVQVGHLPGGFYVAKISDGERVFTGKFCKF